MARRPSSGIGAGDRSGREAASIEVKGLDELVGALNELSMRDIQKTMAATVYGIASDLRKRVRERVPVDSGDLKKSVRVKRRKSTPDNPVVDLWFEPKQGWYWRLIEHGHGGPVPGPARPFLAPCVEQARAEQPMIMRKALQKAIDKRLKAIAKAKMKKVSG